MSRTKPWVLLADDDPGVRFTLGELLAESDVEVTAVDSGDAAWRALAERDYDLVITDLKMPGLDGMELLRRIKEKRPDQKVVMITAHGNERSAVDAMKLGAYDYFPKPFDVEAVAAVVKRATEAVRLASENERLRAALGLGRFMIFRSDAMSRVAMMVERAGPRDVTVLLKGESGTGKELVAQAIVASSPRAKAPFVKFNCAAIPAPLAEAELFGHAEGAFTGAVRARAGLFRQAHGGTLFLDEIGELDAVVQSKLLRVLQEGALRPVGSDKEEKVDVRIVAATHRDLVAEVKAGRFREDLFFRLDVVRIELPPLRDRPEDLEPLIDHFLAKYAERFGLEGARLGSRARAALLAGEYRGNVRELENAVERLVALSAGDEIELPSGPASAPEPLGLKERVDAYERGLILAELRRSAFNRSEAARRLGVSRPTLLDKMKKYGLSDMSDPEEA